MANKIVKFQDLPDEMARALNEWADNVTAEAYQLLEDTAEKMLNEIKRTNVNKKGWVLVKRGQRKTQPTWKRRVQNKDEPTLVHLHEFGHVTRYGTGKQDPKYWPDPRHTKQRVEAMPSVLPAYYNARDEMIEGLKELGFER